VLKLEVFKDNLFFEKVALGILFGITLAKNLTLKMPELKIFYATETGTSKKYAESLKQKFGRSFNTKLMAIPT
jgi:hypothetical protein